MEWYDTLILCLILGAICGTNERLDKIIKMNKAQR